MLAAKAVVFAVTALVAGSQIFIARQRGSDDLGAWTRMGVFTLYAVLALAASLVLVDRRDA